MILKELTEAYLPEKVLHREEQILKIKSTFDYFKKSGFANHLIVQGLSGSGKTLTVTKALSGHEGEYVFASGAQNKTCYKLLKSIFDVNFNTIERVLTEGIKIFKKNPKVVVIDEINKLKNVAEIKELFDNLNTFYRETGCPIILITNQRGIIGIMADDARLTLMPEKIDFKPYNPLQLRDIVKERIESIKSKGTAISIPEGRVEYVCALVFKEADSSVRDALKIIHKCILSGDFSDKTIANALHGIKEENWRDFVFYLSENQKKFLALLLELASKTKKIPFSELSKNLHTKYDPSTISKLLDVFEDYGIIFSENINKGRAGGNKRFVSFSSEQIYEKLNDLMEEVTI